MITTLPYLLVLATTITASTAASSNPITALYIFGDSTVDPGNNDNIPGSLFRADHKPYGVNFPNHVATGRFSDGLISNDYMAKSLGLKELIPAYADLTVRDMDLITGVSFASAGSGLDERTIKISRATNPTDQVQNFMLALDRMENNLGVNETRYAVENAAFLISVGSNDFLFNYYDLPTRRLKYNLSGYSDFIISNLEPIIQSLHELGARRFVVPGLPPLGCLPIQATIGSLFRKHRACVDKQNSAAQLYNAKLQDSLNQLQSQYNDSKFVYGDLYSPLMDMITNPLKYGFETTLEGCCGTGALETGTLCGPLAKLCSNASTYVFWDSIHPTQAAFHVIANYLEANSLSKLHS